MPVSTKQSLLLDLLRSAIRHHRACLAIKVGRKFFKGIKAIPRLMFPLWTASILGGLKTNGSCWKERPNRSIDLTY